MKFLSVLAVLILLNSCENATLVSEEMDAYCDCIQDPVVEMNVCEDIRNTIVRKYEYNPFATEIIQNKLYECVQN